MLQLKNAKVSDAKIKTVGILIDTDNFSKKEELIQAISNNGWEVSVLLFKEKWDKDSVYKYPRFDYLSVNVLGEIKEQSILLFTATPFDMLINYYNKENALLELVSTMSTAKFKVGFTAISAPINQFMIDTEIGNHIVFIQELKKYLNILNKL